MGEMMLHGLNLTHRECERMSRHDKLKKVVSIMPDTAEIKLIIRYADGGVLKMESQNFKKNKIDEFKGELKK